MKLQEPHLEPDAGDIDLSEILQGGIYDYLKNLSTWLMTESCLNYLNFYCTLLYRLLLFIIINLQMLFASEEGKEIDGSGHSHGGDMLKEGVSILQHVSFLVHIIPSIQLHV